MYWMTGMVEWQCHRKKRWMNLCAALEEDTSIHSSVKLKESSWPSALSRIPILPMSFWQEKYLNVRAAQQIVDHVLWCLGFAQSSCYSSAATVPRRDIRYLLKPKLQLWGTLPSGTAHIYSNTYTVSITAK